MSHKWLEYDKADGYIEYRCTVCGVLSFIDTLNHAIRDDYIIYYELNGLNYGNINITCEEYIIKNIIE